MKPKNLDRAIAAAVREAATHGATLADIKTASRPTQAAGGG
jgi:hypothetical protein